MPEGAAAPVRTDEGRRSSVLMRRPEAPSLLLFSPTKHLFLWNAGTLRRDRNACQEPPPVPFCLASLTNVLSNRLFGSAFTTAGFWLSLIVAATVAGSVVGYEGITATLTLRTSVMMFG